jgi:hypothetical protein
VLKITRLSRKGLRLTVNLEREIREAWVDSEREACSEQCRRRSSLDVAGVTNVDWAGSQVLTNLMCHGGASPRVPGRRANC